MAGTIEEVQDATAIQTVIEGTGEVTTIAGSGDVGVTNLNELSDVDLVTEGVQDGSVLVYSTTTSKWTSTLTLEKQLMNGGFF